MQKPTVEPLPDVSGPAVPSAAQGGANVQSGTVDTPAPQQAQKTASTGETGAYRTAKPENVELPTVPIINLSMQTVADMNGGVLPQTGNALRKQAISRARTKLGLDQSSEIYIPASNVTRNGEEYVLKITRSSLDKMLSPSNGGIVSPESIAVIDNIERIANNGVYFKSEGDRKGRQQIAGYDHLMTTVYIDNQPYSVDMRVRVYDAPAGGENRLYYFTPEEIVTTKKVGANIPTGTLHERTMIQDGAPTLSAPIIADSSAGGNTQSAPNKGDLSAMDTGAISGAAYPKTMTVNGREYTVYQEIPEGWSVNDRAMTAPNGYLFIHNNKSLLGGERKTALMPDKWLQDEMAREKRGTMDAPAPQQAQKTASTGEAGSTAVNTDPTRHTPQEQAVINEYQNAVDASLVAFVNKWKTLKNPDYKKRIRMPIAEVSERAAHDVQSATGIDVTGFEHVLSGNALEHIEKRHGASGRADQSMTDVNDIGRMGYVLENYDSVDLLKNDDGMPRTSTEYANADDTPAPMVQFQKKVNGTYYVVEAVPDSAAHQMRVVSAYMHKNGRSTDQVLNVPQNGPQLTPEAPHGANTSATAPIIADSSAGGNTQSAQAGPESSVGAAQAGFTGDTVRGFCSDRAGSFRSNSLPWNSIQIIKEREYIHTLIIEFFMCRTEGDQHD